MSEAVLPDDAHVLVVDDDERLRERLARAIVSRGYTASTARDGEQALEVARGVAPTHAVIDLRMPGASGLEVLAALRAEHPALQVVILTGYGSIATAIDAVRLGAVSYVSKPADVDMVLSAFTRGTAPLTDAPDYEPPSLERVEWEHISRVLEDCGGNITKAARKLGLHRRTLQRKLQRFPPRK